MPPRPPQNWQPLIEPLAEKRRRRKVLGFTTLAAVLSIGIVAAGIGFAVFALNSLPEGYSATDTCWVNDGSENAEGEPIISVPCWEDHDYVSGEAVDREEDCPARTEGYMDEGEQVICLELPR